MTTVHVVNCPVFEYNDEGHYAGETDATLAICATPARAKRWIQDHGWEHIGYAIEDPGECMWEDPIFEGYDWNERPDFNDPTLRQRALNLYLHVKEVEVLT